MIDDPFKNAQWPDEYAADEAEPHADSPLRQAIETINEKAEDLIFASRFILPDERAVYLSGPHPETEGCLLRDIAAMFEGKADMFQPQEARDICRLFLDAQLPDGTVPAAIALDGQPVYQPSTDLPQHAVSLLWHAAPMLGDRDFIETSVPKLITALRMLPRDERTDLITALEPDSHPPPLPRSHYDAANLQGSVFFSSLLYVSACRQLADLVQGLGKDGEADMWRAEAQQVSKRVRMHFWDKHAGLFRAAARNDCENHDLWGSALSVCLNIATSGQLMAIARFLQEHYREVVRQGYLRHLPADQYWSGSDIAPGSRENGGFWAAPAGWLVYTLDIIAPPLAEQTVIDLAETFRRNGVNRSLNAAGQADFPDYAPAAALPLAGIRRMLMRREKREGSVLLS